MPCRSNIVAKPENSGRAAEHALLEEDPERGGAGGTAVEGAPFAVLAEGAALRGDRLELDEIRIDLGLGAGLDRHEGGQAFAAGDDWVISLDHDPAAAGRGKGAAQQRPTLVVLLRRRARSEERRVGKEWRSGGSK